MGRVLTYDRALALAKGGGYVRVMGRGHGHCTTARVVRVLNERKVLLRPNNHGQDEEFHIHNLQEWEARNRMLENAGVLKFPGPPPPGLKAVKVDPPAADPLPALTLATLPEKPREPEPEPPRADERDPAFLVDELRRAADDLRYAKEQEAAATALRREMEAKVIEVKGKLDASLADLTRGLA
jgi:hypothetical protein